MKEHLVYGALNLIGINGKPADIFKIIYTALVDAYNLGFEQGWTDHQKTFDDDRQGPVVKEDGSHEDLQDVVVKIEPTMTALQAKQLEMKAALHQAQAQGYFDIYRGKYEGQGQPGDGMYIDKDGMRREAW